MPAARPPDGDANPACGSARENRCNSGQASPVASIEGLNGASWRRSTRPGRVGVIGRREIVDRQDHFQLRIGDRPDPSKAAVLDRRPGLAVSSGPSSTGLVWEATMDVGNWLRGLGLGRYETAFRDSSIDIDVLPDLTDGDFEKLGVTLGDRKRLL